MFQRGEHYSSEADAIMSAFLILATIILLFVFIRQIKVLMVWLMAFFLRQYKSYKKPEADTESPTPSINSQTSQRDRTQTRNPNWICYRCFTENLFTNARCSSCSNAGPALDPRGSGKLLQSRNSRVASPSLSPVIDKEIEFSQLHLQTDTSNNAA
eukprot:TRINITY_DN85673_c1_g1_i1.p1 TRINITY_DN85673_c1_g1~~TRINITY_DN85673_c1_g1_i1.p1  ORF type:complete len:156 (-),score=1.07 TRINITY_DN85673_c1_g1_i1:31-498(-)